MKFYVDVVSRKTLNHDPVRRGFSVDIGQAVSGIIEFVDWSKLWFNLVIQPELPGLM